MAINLFKKIKKNFKKCLTFKKRCGIITEFRDGTVLRTLKIKQRKKRNLDKNLSTKSTNQIQISETKQGKDNDS